MSNLITHNALAIQQLMNDTLFKDNEVSVDHGIENDNHASLRFWGANGKHILFLLKDPDHEYFSEEAGGAFLKTMAALKLSIEDVAVVNHENARKFSVDEMSKLLAARICIFLGREVWEDTVSLHETFHRNDIVMLNTYTFEEMLNDDEKKRAFWKAIKGLGI